MILGIVKEPEVGGRSTRARSSASRTSAPSSSSPRKDGLLHISRVANGRVAKVEDVLNLGDTVKVEVLEVDAKTARSRSIASISPMLLRSPCFARRGSRSRGSRARSAQRSTPSRQGSRTPRRRHESN